MRRAAVVPVTFHLFAGGVPAAGGIQGTEPRVIERVVELGA